MNTSWFKGLALALGMSASSLVFADSYLLIHTVEPNFANDVRTQIMATGLINGNIDVVNAMASTPSLAQLQSYDAVFVFSSNGFQNGGRLGNNLAEYADGGGGVVVAPLTTSPSGSFIIGGRFATAGYSPFVSGATKQFISRKLGTVYDATHPLMSGVTTFLGGLASLHNQVSMSAGAVRVADYDNGVPLVGAKQVGTSYVVGLNFFPPSGDVNSGYWITSSHGGRLMANALLYSVGVRNVAPVSVQDLYSLSAGESLSVNAPGLLANDTDPDDDPLVVVDEDSGAAGVQPAQVPSHGTLVLNADGSFTYTPFTGFAGQDTFKYRVSDGQESSPAITVTLQVNDTTAPVLSEVPANATVSAVDASGATFHYTMPTATDVVDGTVQVQTTHPSGSTFALGTTTVKFTAQDAAGNLATATFEVTVEDDTAPVIADTPADQVISAIDASGAPFSYSLPNASDNVDGSLTVTTSHPSGSTFPLGETVVTFTATDAAGNTTQTSFKVKVVDTTAPVITGTPSNQVLIATSVAGATLNFALPTAQDNVDGAVAVTSSHPSGAQFPLGKTKVTFTATDAAGNKSKKCFEVWVQYSASSLSTSGNDDKGVKAGANVQVRFSLTGASAPIQNAQATLLVNGNSAGSFSFDAASGLYTTSWRTKGLAAGQYTLRLDLGDGVLRTQTITLR